MAAASPHFARTEKKKIHFKEIAVTWMGIEQRPM